MEGNAESTLMLVASNHPKLTDLVEKIRLYLTSKLYHELTGALTSLLSEGNLSCDVKVQIFETLVHPLKDSLNILKFCTLLKLSSDALEPNVALEQLSKYDNFLEKNLEACLMLQIAKSYHYVINGQLKDCDTMLDDVQEKIEATQNLSLSLHSAFHHACANMHWALKDYSRCYRSWKMFLNYTSINDIPEPDRQSVARNLAISAIISDDFFGFGEVIHEPIVEAYLKGGPDNWLYELLYIFNEGQLELFDEIAEKHRGNFLHAELSNHVDNMRHKIKLVALLNLIFAKPSRQRTISYAEVVSHCKIEIDMVGPFVLKALARGLIKGHIDQIEGIINVSWVQPRILDINKLDVLNKRIQEWANHIDGLCHRLQVQMKDEETLNP
ncbi:bifunctional 26S Proteasome non-ATPase regulatory subunit 13/Proteasome component (PCI) domain [Babesia duncani]|uniref:Bifunctional 26S Proteasome non-ATPase regulatory subunit 13/Proteasome component (PCI) domain n=1 Tax=Babesia duncani TaxID=323732 RepID=A0AAD9PNW5_9APIC|nr:bifunctional 26S Proteasome non-ATPase regulatory subunit 13/Proteasome component (PCI) domain [Babesia duncani]